MRLALILVLAACGGSAPPAPLSHQNDVIPSRPGAPTIAWDGAKLAVTGLPAVARGGEIAVFAVHDSDGGRGFPNLRLEVHDRADKVVQKIDVLLSNDFETLVVDGKPTPAFEQRIAAANTELGKLHGVHELQPMHALELQATPDGTDRHLAIGDGLDVDWSGDHLHVFPHNTDKPLVTMPGTPWLVRDHKPCAQCEVCSNPAYLVNAYHLAGMPMIVVEIGFHGTDTCWEPGNQLHVVTW